MRKLRPSNYWNIGKIESWLSDMASQGYFLQTMDKNFCEFEKGDPKTLSYRIEVAEEGKDLSRDQHLKYKREIWTNVANYNKFYIFSYPYEFVSPEPNLSPEELAKSLKPTFLKTLLQLIGIIIIALLVLRFFPYFLNSTLIVATLRGTSMDIVTFLIFFFGILSLVREAYFQGKLIFKLSKGISIDHHTPWKKTYWISSAIWGAKYILIGCIILSTVTLIYSYEYTMTAKDVALPIVRLADVETADGSTFDESLLNKGYYTKKWSILAPKQYITSEYATTSDNSSNSIDNEYFKLLFPGSQKYMIKSLVADFDNRYNVPDFSKTEPVENDRVDYLIYRDSTYNNLNKHLFAAKDGVIIHLDYWGEKGKEELIKVVSDLLNSETKEV